MPFLDANVLQDASETLGFLRDVLGGPGDRPTLSERFEPRIQAYETVGAPFAESRSQIEMAAVA